MKKPMAFALRSICYQTELSKIGTVTELTKGSFDLEHCRVIMSGSENIAPYNKPVFRLSTNRNNSIGFTFNSFSSLFESAKEWTALQRRAKCEDTKPVEMSTDLMDCIKYEIKRLLKFRNEKEAKILVSAIQSPNNRTELDALFIPFYFETHQLAKAESLLEESQPVDNLNMLLRGFFQHLQLDLVKKVCGLLPMYTLESYEILIDGYSKLGQIENVKQLLESMKQKSVKMSENILASLVWCLSHKELIDSVSEFNSKACSNLICRYIIERNFTDAVKLSTSAPRLEPDDYLRIVQEAIKVEFNLMIQVVWGELKGHGITPSSSLYKEVIQYAFQRDKIEVALALLNEMINNLVDVDYGLFCVLLDFALSNGKIHESKVLLQKMKDLGYVLDNTLHGILAKYFYTYSLKGESVFLHKHFGNLESLQKTFEEKYSIIYEPTVHCYNEIFLKLFQQNDLDKFLKLFERMGSRGVQPNAMTITLLIKMYVIHRDFEKALKVPFVAKYYGIQPERMHFALIFHALCRSDCLAEAENLLLTMKNTFGVFPNSIFYSSLLFYYLGRRDYKKVFSVFDTMEAMDFVPDIETCNHVIRALFDISNVEEGLNFFEKMKQMNLPRNTFSYSIVVRKLIECNMIQEAITILDDCMEEGNSIQDVPFEVLLRESDIEQYDSMVDVIFRKLDAFGVRLSEKTLPATVQYLARILEKNEIDLFISLAVRILLDFPFIYINQFQNVLELGKSKSKHISDLLELYKKRLLDPEVQKQAW